MMHSLVAVAAGGVFAWRMRRTGYSRQQALEAVLVGAIGALIFTRVFFLVTRTRFWELSLLELIDGSRGTASWGAYLGAAIGLACYALLQRGNPLSLMDTAASTAALSCVVGRWSCFLLGDDFGRVTSLPWGIHYPAGSLAWKAHVQRGLIEPSATSSLAVHPNQILLSGAALLTFLATTWYWRGHRHEQGRTLATFLLLYGATRFPIEFLRDPSAGGAAGLLSHSQYMCLAFIAIGLGLHAVLPRRLVLLVPAGQSAMP